MKRHLALQSTPLAGVQVLQRQVLGDARGYLERMFCDEELAEWLGGALVRQINHSATAAAGSVRGFHFQREPHGEGKIVSCLRGEVFDVAVDLRHGSPTFLQWHAELLSATNHRSLMIPPGVAHGFQALETDCELIYFHTTPYEPRSEGGVHPMDPRLNVVWPLPVIGLSPRDAGHRSIGPDFEGFRP